MVLQEDQATCYGTCFKRDFLGGNRKYVLFASFFFYVIGLSYSLLAWESKRTSFGQMSARGRLHMMFLDFPFTKPPLLQEVGFGANGTFSRSSLILCSLYLTHMWQTVTSSSHKANFLKQFHSHGTCGMSYTVPNSQRNLAILKKRPERVLIFRKKRPKRALQLFKKIEKN